MPMRVIVLLLGRAVMVDPEELLVVDITLESVQLV